MEKKKVKRGSRESPVVVARSLGYRFSDESLLLAALTHRSYLTNDPQAVHYERLEFLGDAVLELVSSLALYRRFPDLAEGDLTRFRAILVQGDNLADLGLNLGLPRALRVGTDAARQRVHEQRGVMADVVEACFGAIFLDGGQAAAEEVFTRLLAGQMEALSGEDLQAANPKGAVLELLQRHKRSHEYRTLDCQGPGHIRRFRVGLFVEDALVAEGEGSSLKRAESEAARRYLEEAHRE